jgi:hypothetical protein
MFVEYRFSILNHARALEELRGLCRDADVLEFGCGIYGGLAREALAARAESYVGYDLHEPVLSVPNARFATSDVLSALRAMPDDSAVSISSGFLDTHIVSDIDDIFTQIARVAPRGVHWLAPEDPTLPDRFTRVGLDVTILAPSIYRIAPNTTHMNRSSNRSV